MYGHSRPCINAHRHVSEHTHTPMYCIRLCWGCRISTGAVQPSVAKKVKKKTTHVQGCAAQRIARKTACSLSSLSVFCHCDGDARLGLILETCSQSRTQISETGEGFLIRLIGCTNTHTPTPTPTPTHPHPPTCNALDGWTGAWSLERRQPFNASSRLAAPTRSCLFASTAPYSTSTSAYSSRVCTMDASARSRTRSNQAARQPGSQCPPPSALDKSEPHYYTSSCHHPPACRQPCPPHLNDCSLDCLQGRQRVQWAFAFTRRRQLVTSLSIHHASRRDGLPLPPNRPPVKPDQRPPPPSWLR